MQTTRLLDSYRSSVLQNKQVLGILSRLYRDGPQTEVSLRNILDFPEHDIRGHLNELYKSSFIQMVSESRWGLTRLAEVILGRLGIAQIASASMIDGFEIQRDDNHFLKRCLSLYHESDLDSTLRGASLLRGASYALSALQNAGKASQIDPARLLYAVIVGLDQNSEALGKNEYCRSVLDDTNNFAFTLNYDAFLSRVDRAIDDARNSNHCLMDGPTASDDLHNVVSWSRILSAAEGKSPDFRLKWFVENRAPDLDRAWIDFSRWYEPIDRTSCAYLFLMGATEKAEMWRAGADLSSVLLGRLRAHTSEEFDSFRAFAGAGQERRIPNNLAHLFELNHLRVLLDTGAFDRLSEQERISFLDSMDKLRLDFASRMENLGKTHEKAKGEEAPTEISRGSKRTTKRSDQ